MASPKVSFLKLSIFTEWKTYHLELKPGESLTLGRSPDCRVPVPRSSVSQEHLRVSWTGFELKFEDLKSANGTFRMPQESPFAEATFGPKSEALALMLSKSIVKFSWEPVTKENQTQVAEPTATEVAVDSAGSGVDDDLSLNMIMPSRITASRGESKSDTKVSATQIGAFHNLQTPAEGIKKAPDLVVPAFEVRDHTESRVQLPSQVVPEPKAPPKKLRAKLEVPRTTGPVKISGKSTRAAAWMVATLPSLALLAISFYLGRARLGGILAFPRFRLLQGGIHDAVLLYLSFYKFYFVNIMIVFGITGILTWLVKGALMKSQSPAFVGLSRFVEQDRFWGTRKYKALIIFAFGLAFLWPFLWCHHYGFQFKKLGRYNDLLKLTATFSPAEPVQNIVEFKKFLNDFEGSSFLYKHLLIHQRLRILSECGGVGEGTPWEKKRNCLVLLEAASIETLQDAKPALLYDVAQRVSILLALDGINRTIFVDGRNSPTVNYFLTSLEAIGLDAEKEDIKKIVERPDFDDQKVNTFLRELRNRIEMRLDIRQVELGLPDALYIRVPGPLESGI